MRNTVFFFFLGGGDWGLLMDTRQMELEYRMYICMRDWSSTACMFSCPGRFTLVWLLKTIFRLNFNRFALHIAKTVLADKAKPRDDHILP